MAIAAAINTTLRQLHPPAPSKSNDSIDNSKMALSSSDFVTSQLSIAPELPIFTVDDVQLAFSIAADFVAAQVANNVMVLALSTGRILRIDLERPEDIDGRSCSQFFMSYL